MTGKNDYSMWNEEKQNSILIHDKVSILQTMYGGRALT